MVEEAKVNVFFHAEGLNVIREGRRVTGVVFHSKQGFQAIRAKTVVDCTGDGDIAFAAGAPYRQITSTFWRGRLGPTGDGLSVRDLTKAEIAHRRYWWEFVARLQRTPGWEEVYLATRVRRSVRGRRASSRRISSSTARS